MGGVRPTRGQEKARGQPQPPGPPQLPHFAVRVVSAVSFSSLQGSAFRSRSTYRDISSAKPRPPSSCALCRCAPVTCKRTSAPGTARVVFNGRWRKWNRTATARSGTADGSLRGRRVTNVARAANPRPVKSAASSSARPPTVPRRSRGRVAEPREVAQPARQRRRRDRRAPLQPLRSHGRRAVRSDTAGRSRARGRRGRRTVRSGGTAAPARGTPCHRRGPPACPPIRPPSCQFERAPRLLRGAAQRVGHAQALIGEPRREEPCQPRRKAFRRGLQTDRPTRGADERPQREQRHPRDNVHGTPVRNEMIDRNNRPK